MVLKKAQADNLSREELIEELLKYFDITDKLNGLNNRFEDFEIKKHDTLSIIFEYQNSELLILKICNSMLLKRITNLGRNALNNAQYVRREINP